MKLTTKWGTWCVRHRIAPDVFRYDSRTLAPLQIWEEVRVSKRVTYSSLEEISPVLIFGSEQTIWLKRIKLYTINEGEFSIDKLNVIFPHYFLIPGNSSFDIVGLSENDCDIG